MAMKWILYIMLFSTPAANVSNKDDKACLKMKDVTKIDQILTCRQNFESKHVWSLQGTSQIEFTLFESCVRTQDQLIANANVASTMTLRTWCFCEAPDAKCPTPQQAKQAATLIRECEKKDSPSCQENNSITIQGFTKNAGQNSTSIRLYPPD